MDRDKNSIAAVTFHKSRPLGAYRHHTHSHAQHYRRHEPEVDRKNERPTWAAEPPVRSVPAPWQRAVLSVQSVLSAWAGVLRVLFGEVESGEFAEELDGFAVVGAGGLDGRDE